MLFEIKYPIVISVEITLNIKTVTFQKFVSTVYQAKVFNS